MSMNGRCAAGFSLNPPSPLFDVPQAVEHSRVARGKDAFCPDAFGVNATRSKSQGLRSNRRRRRERSEAALTLRAWR